MYSSSSLSKRFILVPVLAIQLQLISSVLSLNMTNAYLNHKCMASQGKYQPKSTYEEELKFLIEIINKDTYAGYKMATFEGGPHNLNISAILQCRGDSYGPKCRDCFTTALAGLRRRCPRFKGAIIWYDQCLLAISSSVYSIGMIDYENNFCMSNSKSVDKDKFPFEVRVDNLIGDLTFIATNFQNESDPEALYAAGERWFKKTKLYGMVQCTQDLSPKTCLECITFNALHFQDCLRDKQGGRVVGRSCNYRFELYPFVTKFTPKYLKL